MDPSLLREQQQFKRKAFNIPTVEKRKCSTQLDGQQCHKKQKLDESELNKDVKTSSKKHQNFGLLASTVKHLRKKYLEGNQNPLTLEQILQEINKSDIDPNVKSWLGDSLKDNPRVQVIECKFLFKPFYKIKDRLAFLNLLKKHDIAGCGGILWEDVVESLPNAEHVLKELLQYKRVKIVTRNDKAKVLFRDDANTNLEIDEDFKKLWNTVDVDALDENKVCDYLNKHGLTPMKGEGFKRPLACKYDQKDGTRKGKPKKNKDNVHLEGVLETYDDDTLTTRAS